MKTTREKTLRRFACSFLNQQSTFWLGAAGVPRAPRGPGRADGAPEGRCVRARRSGRAPDGQVDGGWTGPELLENWEN